MMPIPSCPGYCATADGTIWSLLLPGREPNVGRKHRDSPLALKKKVLRGYNTVGIGRTTKKVSRLVLEAFVGPCPDGMEACHENGDRSDDRLDNLRWDTRKNNHADKIRHGTAQRGERHGMAKLTDSAVMEIRRRRAAGEPFSSLAAEYGVAVATVHGIHYGRSHTHLPILYPKPMSKSRSGTVVLELKPAETKK